MLSNKQKLSLSILFTSLFLVTNLVSAKAIHTTNVSISQKSNQERDELNQIKNYFQWSNSFYKEIYNTKKESISFEVKNNNVYFNICAEPNGIDTDGDGVNDVCDLDDDNDGILDSYEINNSNDSKVWVNTASKKIGYYDTSTNTTTLPITTTSLYGDIGFDLNGDLYGVTFSSGNSELKRINQTTGAETTIGDLGFKSANALSFLPDGTALIGSGAATIDSKIYKVTVSPYTKTIWADLSVGNPAGDFVYLNGKIYCSWFRNGQYYLYEITVDSQFNYVSYVSLGVLSGSYGLAAVGGELYTIHATKISKITVSNGSFTESLTYTAPTSVGEMYGSTGMYEAYGFTVSDTDGDGIPNHLDLDSDNDGCSDAYEAEVTTNTATDFQFDGTNVGVNGFEDSLETSEDGVYTGTYIYSKAVDGESSCPTDCATINNMGDHCDFDGDGIINSEDLDDDNDGVLDTEEYLVCFDADTDYVGPDYFESVFIENVKIPSGYSGDPTPLWIDGDISTGWDPFTWEDQSLPIKLTFELIGPLTTTAFLLANDYGIVGDGIKSATVKLYDPNGDILGVETFDTLLNDNSSGIDKYDFSKAYYNVKSFVVEVPWTGKGTGGAKPNFQIREFASFTRFPSCAPLDTDGDGISNHFDLDSDNDGCSDAYEAGVVTSNIETIAGPYGSNGFADSMESNTNEDLYKGVYTYYYAENAALNGCSDTDADGLPDLYDLDDDNDGILDAVESPECFFTLNELEDINTTDFDTDFTWSENATLVFEKSHDQDIATYASQTPVVSDITGLSLIEWTPYRTVAITDATIKKARYLSASTSNGMYRLEGWNGSSWEVLSLSNHLYVGSIDVTFTNTLHPGVIYHKYRIAGESGASRNGGRFYDFEYNVDSSTIPSLYPKDTCTSDFDGDGILNHYDLDSDGDGCPDALEGDGTFTSDDLVTDTTVSGGNSGTGYTGTDTAGVQDNLGLNINTNGVPIVSPATTAVTQGVGYSQSTILSTCKDTDGDGIVDIEDIDDDNDGVLDAVESPSCFATLDELEDINTAAFSTEFPWSATATIVFDKSHDKNVATYASQTPVVSNITGLSLIEWTPSNAVAITDATIKKARYLSASTSNGMYRLEGWNGSSWEVLSLSNHLYVASIDVTFTNTLQTGVIYDKYRIAGESGTSRNAGRFYDLEYNVDSSTALSLLPKETCISDLDNDGIPNYLDLDSDNDGCPDAMEASVGGILESNDSIAKGPYGENGLADGVETTPESGIVNYTSTYSDALTDLVNECIDPCTDPSGVDSDGDGVNDDCDMDSDNDGILNTEEGICNTYTTLDFDTQTVGSTIASISPMLTSEGVSVTITDTVSDPSIVEIKSSGIAKDYMSGPNDNYIDLGMAFTGTPGEEYRELKFKFDKKVSNLNFYISDIDKRLDGVKFSDVVKVIPRNNGTDIKVTQSNADMGTAVAYIGDNTFVGTTNNIEPANKEGKLSIDLEGIVVDELVIRYSSGISDPSPTAQYIGVYNLSFCTVLDSDNDGVPNFLDLDSDNDGIYDVVEAGGTDANNDGEADNSTGNYIDNFGIPDSTGFGLTPRNTVTETDPDYLNSDSDGDGCSDTNEAYNNLNTDTNNDGTYDGVITAAEVDENGLVKTAAYTTPNTNYTTVDYKNSVCYVDHCSEPSGVDTDKDGVNDICDIDMDNDGVLNSDENCNTSQWGTAPWLWTAGDDLGTITISPGIDLSVEVTTTASGNLDVYGGTAIDLANQNLGGIDDLGVYFDPDADQGKSPVSIKVDFTEKMYNLNFKITDIDGGNLGFRLDKVTVTSDVGTPILQKVSDSHSSFTIENNSATALKAISSNNNDVGTVLVIIPDGAKSITILYEEMGTISDPNGRGIGILGELNYCLDTDKDGIVDAKDLDSDNDGCSDALEANFNPDLLKDVTGWNDGTNGSSVGFTNAQVAGHSTTEYGDNGLSDVIETDDTTTATVVMNNYLDGQFLYNPNALNAAIKDACKAKGCIMVNPMNIRSSVKMN